MKSVASTFILVFVVILVGGLILGGNYYLLEIKTEQIKDEIQKHHAMEFGGIENYQLAKQAFTSDMFVQQNRMQLQDLVEQTWGDVQSEDAIWDDSDIIQDEQMDPWQESDDWFDRWQIDTQQVEDIANRWNLYWQEWAKITWIEYSDVNCPFCEQQSKDETVFNVMDNFEDNELNHFFRTYPVFGDRSMPGAYALECAWYLGWQDLYYDFKADFFELSDMQDPNAWEKLATDYWIDTWDFTSCVDNEETADIVSENMEEWQIFGITGTPGNLLLNNETGEWVLVPWAYPAETFNNLISDMLQ